ncbi:hypothetical protein [Desulfurivibrio dismutans]|uniref:hypothetical protein n=1 Tax=Desulfurivibrio dismutans TaxID=1398908 RepID=UPI0023DC3B24|nr:hypothetical protein [Desulfurivibrio alkaliphilus]MDF1613951.1 hypothetical protein [Desulfurivibrio alkaliphilus]
MNTLKFSIALLGSTALLLTLPVLASANDTDSGERKFAGSMLSRFLPSSEPQGESWNHQELPSRFSLGFFTAGVPLAPVAAPEEEFHAPSYLDDSPPTQITALANFGYGSYYGVSRLDTNNLSLLPGMVGLDDQLSANELPRDDNLSLSLEAGLRHQQLNTGMLYAYQSGYPTSRGPISGSPSFPSYIFTPLGPVSEQHRDQRGPEGHAVFFYLGYNHTPQLNLRGSVGLAKTAGGISSDDPNHLLNEQSRRWGVDIAATYRLLDNLVYQAHLGYVSIDESPSAAETPVLHTGSDATPQSAGQNSDSIFHIGSHIRMTF